MFADDRVLVAYVPSMADFKRIQSEGWYRIPQKHAPKGLYAEWIAFYFGRNAPQKYKHTIPFYAKNLGHELTYRRDLIPSQPNHKRADDIYYKIQLGELITMERPIVSLKWRRILFVHTTGDRFRDSAEINDLFIEGDQFVDRVFTALKDGDAEPYAVLRESE